MKPASSRFPAGRMRVLFCPGYFAAAGAGPPRLARRRPLRLPRLPPLPLLRRRRGARAGPGQRAGPHARRLRHVAPRAARHRRREGGRTPTPDHHEGQLALHGAPLRVPRLHRHQDGRRQRRRRRRAPVHRAVHLERVPRLRARHPLPRGEGRRGAGRPVVGGGPRAAVAASALGGGEGRRSAA
mgnify:CR=1 FL=1